LIVLSTKLLLPAINISSLPTDTLQNIDGYKFAYILLRYRLQIISLVNLIIVTFFVQGDGGSPLVCEQDSVSYLIGLVSWGIGCGTASIPGVYIDVSFYIKWIEKQIYSEESRL
jgi:hypothetical protein